MTDPERQRRRPAVSCVVCRKRKIRCNREIPCSNCVRSRNQTCVYENYHYPSHRPGYGSNVDSVITKDSHPSLSINRAYDPSRGSKVPSHCSSSPVASSTNESTPLSGQDIESLKNKIKEIEEQLAKATPKDIQSSISTSRSNIDATSSRRSGTFYVHRKSRVFGGAQTICRSITHKTRLFGRSHWINVISLIQDICGKINETHHEDETLDSFSGLRKCKSLAKVIKSRRAPSWPSPLTAILPSKSVADELVDCYLRTTETVFRILHIPTFRTDYEALWGSGTEPDTAFMVQLKLVLAIGATTYDEQFSMRAEAIRWVYEGLTWLSEPKPKSRLCMRTLQTNLLLLLAREAVGIGGDSIWISAGELFRRAVHMGMHRDPARLPRRTTFDAEMRRRLWNTILEVNLQSSLTAGGPPFVSLADFDTEPPNNFDDDQLIAEDPVPRSEDEFTQMSIAIALRKTFPLRLAVTKFLNDLTTHGTYEEALQLDAELRATCKSLYRAIQVYQSRAGASPSSFEKRVVDLLMHRYLSSLHVPFFGLALHETAYAFSRKVVVETSLKIWCAVNPSQSIMAAQSRDNMISQGQDYLARLTLCGSGFFRTVAIQAALLIAVELRTQLQEEESLGPVPLRPDLLSVLEEAKTWCLQCIVAGETNIRGYLLMCVISAQIKGLIAGFEKEELSKILLKAAEDAEVTCLPILEAMAARGRAEGIMDDTPPMDTLPEAIEDWDFMISGALFDPTEADPMNWMFNEDGAQGLSLW